MFQQLEIYPFCSMNKPYVEGEQKGEKDYFINVSYSW